MDIPGFGTSEKVDRVDHGSGVVRQHSLAIGDTVIVFNNIGTISIIDGVTSPWPLFVGGIIAFIGLLIFFVPNSPKPFAFLILIAGVALAVWGIRRKPDRFLSIGTCDGKRTNIVSKNRAFLEEVREFLQTKIETGLGTARLDISAGRIDVLTVGDHTRVTMPSDRL